MNNLRMETRGILVEISMKTYQVLLLLLLSSVSKNRNKSLHDEEKTENPFAFQSKAEQRVLKHLLMEIKIDF